MKNVVLRYVVAAMAAVLAANVAVARDELQLPSVPDSLRTPARRADFIVEHFWDAMDWRDTLLTRDEPWMEQNFVNFASLFPHASREVVNGAVAGVLDGAACDATAYRMLLGIADRYLYEPESPMHDEESYIAVLEAVLADSVLDPVVATRYSYQLREALRNRLGTRAADFPMTLAGTRSGDTTLYGLLDEADETLVIFYDPECDHCIEVISALAASASVARRIASGNLAVVAVYFEGEPSQLPALGKIVPGDWVSAYTPGNPVEENELYAVRRLPSLYLIGRDGIVSGKDIDPGVIAD